MISDPISDFVTRIKNAVATGKASVPVPFSSFKMAIAEKLKDAGYVKSIERKGKKVRKTLDIVLQYSDAGKPAVSGARRISKPGRRVYKSAHEIVPVRYGHGSLVLSTPKGIMTDKEARKARVGGEALFEIW